MKTKFITAVIATLVALAVRPLVAGYLPAAK